MGKMERKELVVILGLPGAGKSFFARALAEKLQGIHLNSDIVRKELLEQPTYSENEKARVYQELFNRVRKSLEKGELVIVDATFSKFDHRLPYYNLIRKLKGKLSLIQIVADESVIRERLSKKRPDSDADYKVYQKIKDQYDEITLPYLMLSSTSLNIDEMLKEAVRYLEINELFDE